MPTGYTNQLDKKDFDVKKWISESLVRNFGVCVAFRDSGEMTKEEMLDIFEKNAKNPYYKRELAKAIAEREKLTKLCDAEWKEKMENANKKEKEYYDKANAERRKIREGHEKTRLWLSGLLTCDISEVTKNIVKYGLEQLKTVEREYEADINEPTLCNNVSDFSGTNLKEAQRHIDYCKKELIKERERETERLQIYKRILEDVENFEDVVNAYCVAERLSH